MADNNVKPSGTETDPDDGEDETIEQVPLFKKMRIILPVLILLTAAVFAGYYWYLNFRQFDSTDDAFIDGNRVAISSKILGRVVFQAAMEGDSVKAGEVLVRLDDSDLRSQEAQAKAAIAASEQNVTLANVNLEKAKDDYARAQKQFGDKVIPQEEFEHAQRASEVAQAQVSIAVAQVGNAKAQLEVIETNLQNTTIVSPMDGVVSKRWLLVGDVVQPAQPIYSVYDTKNIWITAEFEETKLGSIVLNQPVEINIDTYASRPFHGKVFQIGSNTASQFSLIPPNNASGNFTKVTQRVPLKISIDDPRDPAMPLLPGMSVEVKIRVRQ
jgi:membrane fusion protein (multidrug efflux system)